MRLGVVILAAGASSRMGRPKLLLPWGDTTVLGHLLRQWTAADAQQTSVVIATNDVSISSELDRLGFPSGSRIENPQRERGMFSSIQCAARWNGWHSETTHVAISLGDQPHLRSSTLTKLVAFAREHTNQICQPSWGGRARHPVIFPRAIFEQLRQTPAGTLKEFLQPFTESRALCAIDDPGLEFDMDEPKDYKRALRLCFGTER